MGKRRTRQDKEKAALHRLTVLTASKKNLTISQRPEIHISIPDTLTSQNNTKQPAAFSEYPNIKKDIRRSLISIVLALTLELSVYYFLYSAHQTKLPFGF